MQHFKTNDTPYMSHSLGRIDLVEKKWTFYRFTILTELYAIVPSTIIITRRFENCFRTYIQKYANTDIKWKSTIYC